MKVLIDANPVYSEHLTGVGYFTDELIKHLSGVCEVEGFAFNLNNSHSRTLGYKVQEQVVLPGKFLTLPRYLGIDLPLGIFFKINCDIVLGTNFLLPPTGKTKNVVMVHDLCFIDHPEWVQGRNAMILRKMLGKTISRSSGVIANSKFTADRIRDHYGYLKPILTISIPPKKSSAGTKNPFTDSLGMKKNFFLFISTVEPRKNIKTLLDAFESLPSNIQKKHPLILAGKPGWDVETLERLKNKTNENIIYLSYVSESERNWLYKNALATVIPSHYEGFGMMTLESLDVGTPVITSNIPPQKEILGKYGKYFNPKDVKNLANLLIEFTDIKKRNAIKVNQTKVIKNYSWDKTTHQVAGFCASIIKND